MLSWGWTVDVSASLRIGLRAGQDARNGHDSGRAQGPTKVLQMSSSLGGLRGWSQEGPKLYHLQPDTLTGLTDVEWELVQSRTSLLHLGSSAGFSKASGRRLGSDESRGRGAGPQR